MTSTSSSSNTSSPTLQYYSNNLTTPLLGPDPTTTIPGITHPLTISTILPSHCYNQLADRPPPDSSTVIPSSILQHFGRILINHGLDKFFGSHLIYRRFPISEGNFVSAAANGGKKVVWQSALWELGAGEEQKLDFLRGRLVMLRTLGEVENPGRSSWDGSNYKYSPIQGYNKWGSSRKSVPGALTPSRHVPTSPSIPEGDESSLKPRCILGVTHVFQAYEYEYGPPHPCLNQTAPTTTHSQLPPPVKIPSTFLPTLATFLVENRLEHTLGLEVFDYKPPGNSFTQLSRHWYVVEEFDPISQNRKAAVMEARGGRELSWEFRKGGRVFGLEGGGEDVEVDVEVGLVMVNGHGPVSRHG